MLCPNAFSWSKGLKKKRSQVVAEQLLLSLLSFTVFVEFPIFWMRKLSAGAATNTMTKCSCSYKSPVLCVQDMQTLHDGKRGRKDISFVYWAICHVGQSYCLWIIRGWFCSFLIEKKKIKSPIAQVSFSWLMKLEKKSARGKDNYFICSVRPRSPIHRIWKS